MGTLAIFCHTAHLKHGPPEASPNPESISNYQNCAKQIKSNQIVSPQIGPVGGWGWAMTDVMELCDPTWSHMCAIFLIGEIRKGMDFPFTSNHLGTSVMTGKILRGHGALCLITKTVSLPGQAGSWLSGQHQVHAYWLSEPGHLDTEIEQAQVLYAGCCNGRHNTRGMDMNSKWSTYLSSYMGP